MGGDSVGSPIPVTDVEVVSMDFPRFVRVVGASSDGEGTAVESEKHKECQETPVIMVIGVKYPLPLIHFPSILWTMFSFTET